uniref:Uncharacterized protein n=1 Tax=Araneus ventricosus TaxID=182803 RepID=A0A4Y2VZH4_ARAVE|nr:hypothetical protein AVEN_96617-1 [Araneus ventricosus]GBO29290.1 hypothetical protein AVEN_148653-1 [Araneus ventricosus]
MAGFPTQKAVLWIFLALWAFLAVNSEPLSFKTGVIDEYGMAIDLRIWYGIGIDVNKRSLMKYTEGIQGSL